MSGNNNEWKKFGGLSKINSFNVINTGTLIADQFVSRSSRPTSQTFAGTLEVTVDLLAGNNIISGNNIHSGNSITAFADIFINKNAYVNHKIKEKYGDDFSLDVMDDTINISWDINVESIKQKHIETWWDKE